MRQNLPLGIAAIVMGVLGLSLGDAAIKASSAGFGLWQIFVLRSALVMAVLAAAALLAFGPRSLLPRAFGWVALRSGLLTTAWIAYYSGLPYLDLAVAATGIYTAPIFIALFAALFVREPINRYGWLAVFIGFAGVLVILRPGLDAFNAVSLLPVLGGMLYALSMVLTRAKCLDEHPLALAFGLSLAFVVFGLVAMAALFVMQTPAQGFLTASWTPMGRDEWILIFAMAVSLLVGSVCTAIAYQNGPASVIGVFDFTYLCFAVLWGVIFFGNVPDGFTAFGISMICAAGILSAWSRRAL